jgi:hypothetical protein
MSVQVYSDQYDETTFDNAAATRDSGLRRGSKGDDALTSNDETSKLAGTDDEELLKEIEELELEHVRMNSRLKRQRLITSAKAMRELKGDVGYKKDLGRELQKKRKEQQAHNDEREWELAKSEDPISVMMSAYCQTRTKSQPAQNANWDDELTIDTITINDDHDEDNDNDNNDNDNSDGQRG